MVNHSNLLTKFHRKFHAFTFSFFCWTYRLFNHNDIIHEDLLIRYNYHVKHRSYRPVKSSHTFIHTSSILHRETYLQIEREKQCLIIVLTAVKLTIQVECQQPWKWETHWTQICCDKNEVTLVVSWYMVNQSFPVEPEQTWSNSSQDLH